MRKKLPQVNFRNESAIFLNHLQESENLRMNFNTLWSLVSQKIYFYTGNSWTLKAQKLKVSTSRLFFSKKF